MTGAASEVVVRRCRVRVVRRGGWSWGPHPRRLVDLVLQELPTLLAARFGDLGVDDDVEFTEPVRIVFSLPIVALAGSPRSITPSSPHWALAAAGAPPQAPAGDGRALAERVDDPSGRSMGAQPPVPGAVPVTTLLGLLATLHQSGEFAALLAVLPATTLARWLRVLADFATAGDRVPDEAGYPADQEPAPGGAAVPFERRGALRRPGAGSTDPGAEPTGVVARSAAIDSPASAAGTATDPGDVRAAQVATLQALAAQAASPGSEALGAPRAGPSHAVGIRRPAARHLTGFDADVGSALPFLVLNPLSRLGYLRALPPMLEPQHRDPARLAGELAAFATALAYAVLRPVERGWRRDPGDVVTAAAFAGRSVPVPEPHLVELARRVEAALPGLDAIVAASLAGGHSAGRPLLLVGVGDRAGGGLLLTDLEGLFPLAWVLRIEDVLVAWRACGRPLLLVRPTGLPDGVPRLLDDAGVRFVVDVPPTRHEHWRRLPSTERLWTNDHDGAPGPLLRQAVGFADLAARLDDVVHALAVQRQAVPLAAAKALRRSLLLAATLALGTIAWTMWRTREPTDPLLALERFGDLTARVRLDDRAVHVRLPLGRRHADLLAHGLLADVAGVPWLGGRVVEFSGG